MNTNKLRYIGIAVFLIASATLIITFSYSFFSNEETVTNMFTLGKITIDLEEPGFENPCDPSIEFCGYNPPCDPNDPDCKGIICDPRDPDCDGIVLCDKNDPDCNGIIVCDPNDPDCKGIVICDPNDPTCKGIIDCDPTDPDCEPIVVCDSSDPTCEPIVICDPNDPDCKGIVICDSNDPTCNGIIICDVDDPNCDGDIVCDDGKCYISDPKVDITPGDGDNMIPGKTIIKDPTLIFKDGNSYARLNVEFLDANGNLITNIERINLIKQTIYFDLSYDGRDTYNLVPGKSYTSFDLEILEQENKIYSLYNYEAFSFDTSRSTGTKLIFNCNGVMKSPDQSVLFTNIVIPLDFNNADIALLGNFSIKIYGEAIQSDGFISMEDAFNELDGVVW